MNAHTPGPQDEQSESHYGLVLALQLHIPDLSLDLVQSAAADDPLPSDLLGGLFRITFSDLQTTLAIDEDIQDMRCLSHS